MSEPDRIVTREVYWNNAHIDPPLNGQEVRALNHDGVDVGKVIWNRDSLLYYDAWLPFAKVPQDVKQIQVGRYLAKWPNAVPADPIDSTDSPQ